MNQLIYWGGIIQVFSMLLLISVTISLYMSTRKSFINIVKRTRSIVLGDTVETLISRADNNLYKAKEKGRNCVVF